MGDGTIERLTGRGVVKYSKGSTTIGHRRYTITAHEEDASIEGRLLGGGKYVAPATYQRIELEIEWVSELEKANLFGKDLVLQLEPPDNRRLPFIVVSFDGDIKVLGGFQHGVEGA
jgi:hypothetical protein